MNIPSLAIGRAKFGKTYSEFRKRVDKNQPAIVAAFRKLGCVVQHLHKVGKGCPDLLVSIYGQNILAEVKSAKGKLTPDQERWHFLWCGQVDVVRTVEDVQKLVERAKKISRAIANANLG